MHSQTYLYVYLGLYSKNCSATLFFTSKKCWDMLRNIEVPHVYSMLVVISESAYAKYYLTNALLIDI